MDTLQADAITFGYKKNRIFDSASLRVKSGEIIGIVGPNGSGKTTFFDLICGLKESETGTLRTASQHSYLSQTIYTPPTLRMSDIFRMTVALTSPHKLTCNLVSEKLAEWSPGIKERFGQIYRKKSSICSYGEKRWFFALLLLAMERKLIILDEPTAGVDPEFRFYIWQCIAGAAREGAAVLVSSHHIDEIAEHCDRFYVINHRKFVEFGDGDEFKRHFSADSLDQAFIRASASLVT